MTQRAQRESATHVQRRSVGMSKLQKPVYTLASHAFACGTADGVVLLDLRKNQYIGVDWCDSDAIAGNVQGWPSRTSAQQFCDDPVHPILQQMLADGQVTSRRSGSNVTEPALIAVGDLDLCSDLALAAPAVSAWDVTTFGVATVLSKLEWRTWSIERMVNGLRRAKAKANSNSSAALTETLRLALVCYFLRPWFRSAKDQCLFDSMALMKFLALHGASATLVIGVRTGPFAAHCWVQADHIILNSSVDHCRQFIPILVV